MSHCVNYTTRDIIEHWDRSMSGVVVLTDGTYAVLLVVSILCLYRARYCVRCAIATTAVRLGLVRWRARNAWLC
jgi:ribosomal protein S26